LFQGLPWAPPKVPWATKGQTEPVSMSLRLLSATDTVADTDERRHELDHRANKTTGSNKAFATSRLTVKNYLLDERFANHHNFSIFLSNRATKGWCSCHTCSRKRQTAESRIASQYTSHCAAGRRLERQIVVLDNYLSLYDRNHRVMLTKAKVNNHLSNGSDFGLKLDCCANAGYQVALFTFSYLLSDCLEKRNFSDSQRSGISF
jgi:hypothetical protein